MFNISIHNIFLFLKITLNDHSHIFFWFLCVFFNESTCFHNIANISRRYWLYPFELLTKRSVSPESAILILPSPQLFPIATPMRHHPRLLSSNNLFTHEPERS